MRILVTGATGFLGKALAFRLAELGHDVTATGRNRTIGESLVRPGVAFLPLELGDRPGLEAALAGQDAVCHSAALSSPWGPYDDFYQANVVGTRNIIDACVKNHVGRLLHVSSPTVYFDHTERHGVKEDDPLPRRGVNAYAVTKLLADQLVLARPELPATIFRPRGIFGPGDTAILPRMIRANERGMVPIIGSEDPVLDLTYVDNVVDAMVAALDAPAAVGKVYNLTNGEPVKLWATLERVFGLLEVPFKPRRMSRTGAYAAATAMEILGKLSGNEPVLTRYTVGVLSTPMTLDISAARRDLGYAPRVSMEEGMARFVQWWKETNR
jgi:nucleoside-diphosphate-sugar epimerase